MSPETLCTSSLMLELQELFIDSIFDEELSQPRLLGQHTFSSKTINGLTKFRDQNDYQYINHPYTREKFYISNANQLPKNIIIEDLFLIYRFYCKKNKITDQSLKNLMSYFVKLFVTRQKKINTFSCFFNLQNQIQDLMLKKIVDLLNISQEEITNILSMDDKQLADHNNYGYKLTDNEFNNILFLAIKYNLIRLINLLLLTNCRIDVNLKDKQGKTSFFWACYHNNVIVAKMLVELGADIYIKDKKNNTPFSWAYRNNNKGILDLAKKLFNNIDHNDSDYIHSKLLWNYHHKKHLHKQNNQLQEEDNTLEWTLVVSKNHRRFQRINSPVNEI